MDPITIGLGLGIVGAAALIDARGLDWAQKIVSQRIEREAMSSPLIRDFPSSSYEFKTLDAYNKKA